MISKKELAAMVDHTNLKPYATAADMKKLCDEAVKYGFAMVAINPAQVARCKEYLKGTPVHVGAAIGFPLGQNLRRKMPLRTGPMKSTTSST